MTLPAPYYADASVTLYHGDALDLLPLLAPGSVDVVATAIGIEVDEHSCEVAASRLSRLPVERSDGQRVLFGEDDAA